MSQPLSQKVMRCARKAAPACLTVWALALAACGGSDGTSPPDPLQPYRAQVVQWTECDPGILGQPSDAMNALRGSQRLRCALVRAPLDWGNPAHGDITLAVMRLAAGKPEARRGALLFNPGGPGVDGLNLTFRLWDAFAGSSPADAQGARQLRLLDEYDMVGFSPRGVGASTQLQCGTNEPSRFVDYSVTGWDTPGNLANVHYNGRKTAEACQKNPLTPHISTEAMARDMDLLRSLLGDDKLNYVGYSYGSWLGAWYAGLFPDKVGRMVLDSVMDFGVTMEQALLHAQPPARQRLFDEVLAPYAARHADYFRLGTSAAEVRAAVQALSPSVQAVLGEALSGLSYFRVDANGYLERITVAQGLDAVRQQVPGLDDPDAVKAALARHVFDPAIPRVTPSCANWRGSSSTLLTSARGWRPRSASPWIAGRRPVRPCAATTRPPSPTWPNGPPQCVAWPTRRRGTSAVCWPTTPAPSGNGPMWQSPVCRRSSRLMCCSCSRSTTAPPPATGPTPSSPNCLAPAACSYPVITSTASIPTPTPASIRWSPVTCWASRPRNATPSALRMRWSATRCCRRSPSPAVRPRPTWIRRRPAR